MSFAIMQQMDVLRLSSGLFYFSWSKSFLFFIFSSFIWISESVELSTKCPVLSQPSNSFISYSHRDFIDGTTATYSCLPGYELFGEPQRTCSRGRWLGSSPVCAINIAIRQPAKQTSNATEFTVLQGTRQAYEAAAYLAVDGTKLYCSKTTLEPSPSWSVTFPQSYPVVAIKIYGDALLDVNDIEIALYQTVDNAKGTKVDLQSISESVDKSEKSAAIICTLTSMAPVQNDQDDNPVKQNVMIFSCPESATARQVLISRSSYTALRLCEVEVFSQEGVPCQHPGSPANGIVKLSQVDWPFPPGAVAVYDCNAGYTRIPTDSAYHRTCRVNGTWDVQEPVCVTNVAQYKLANQSTLFSQYNYPAWQAIDGDPNSCAWTRREREPWFQIDLMTSYTVHAVSVLLDKERLFYQFHRNLLISVSDHPNDRQSGRNAPVLFRRNLVKDTAPGSGIFYLERPTAGRYVTMYVVGNTEKFLGICDIQVLASDETPATPEYCGLQTPPTAFLYSYQRTCYQVQRFTATNWYNAMLSCQDNGGSLIINPDYDSSIFLSSILSNLYRFHASDDRYWISAKLNKDTGQWVFVTRNSTTPADTTYWAPGRPLSTQFVDYESCVALGGPGIASWSWADYRCDQDPANWICSYVARGCGDPVQPEASALLVSSKLVGASGWKIGDQVQYECAPGYLLTGSLETICQADGTWSGQGTNCQYISCGSPPKRSHLSSVLLNGTVHLGSLVQYYCIDEASKLVGQSVISCLPTGSWEHLDILCEMPAKPVLTHLEPQNVNDDLVVFNGTAVIPVMDSAASVHTATTSHPEAIGVGVGVAVSIVVLAIVFIYCGIRYRRKKLAMMNAVVETPVKKRTSPYSTIRRLQASQISAPIAVMQTGESTPKTYLASSEYDITPQISVTSSTSDDTQSADRSENGGSLSPSASNPSESTNYLKSFGKAGIAKLYQKAKLNGTLRGFPFGEEPPSKERPKVPRLVISSPIECRKTVVLDSGTEYARTGTEVIYAQPGKMNGMKVGRDVNQYEYLETARVHGGYGNPMENLPVGHDPDEGVYADTSVSGSSQHYLASRTVDDEVYDDVKNNPAHSDNDENNKNINKFVRR